VLSEQSSDVHSRLAEAELDPLLETISLLQRFFVVRSRYRG
jgi:hypothetical protein